MKKLFKLMIATMMALTMLAGCGDSKQKEESNKAKDLIQNAIAEGDEENFAETISYSLAGTVIAEGFSVDLTMSMELDVSLDHHKVYATGPMKMAMMGMDFEIPQDIYIIEEEGKFVSYIYNSESEAWIKAETDAANVDEYAENVSEIGELSQYKTYELTEEDGKYVVTGKLSGEGFAKAYMDSLSQASGLDIDMTTEDIDYKMVFNKDTGKIESYGVKIPSITSDTVKIDEYELIITYKQFGGVTVEVPQEIIDSAVQI